MLENLFYLYVAQETESNSYKTLITKITKLYRISALQNGNLMI